jgi:hypothetical protein
MGLPPVPNMDKILVNVTLIALIDIKLEYIFKKLVLVILTNTLVHYRTNMHSFGTSYYGKHCILYK